MTSTDLRRSKGLLIDSNMLVLWAIGALNVGLVGDNKRVQTYIPEDYGLLLRVISEFQSLAVTPNILTETSNLLENISYQGVTAWSVLEKITERLDEIFLSSLDAMHSNPKIYEKFGLTDTVIHSMAKENYIVLTQDLRLCSYLEGTGLRALNFNNLRSSNLLR